MDTNTMRHLERTKFHLDVLRSRGGNVRITFGDVTVSAEVLHTEVTRFEDSVFLRDYLQVGFKITASASEIIVAQAHVLKEVMQDSDGLARCIAYTPEKETWYLDSALTPNTPEVSYSYEWKVTMRLMD